MRKAFWCSLASGIMLAGGVFTVAHFAANHPQSYVGRVIISAGQLAVTANPLVGGTPFVTSFERVPQEAAAEAVQAGGVELAEELQPAEPVQGPIVIPEGEPVAPHPEFDQVLQRVVESLRKPAEIECPAGQKAGGAAVMPYCKDEEECEEHSAEATLEKCETLKMPSIEEEGEEQEESPTGSTGAAEKLFRTFERASRKAETGAIETPRTADPKPACCPGHSGCPRGGHEMHCPAGGYRTPAQSVAPGTEEPSEPVPPPGSHSSALREMHRFEGGETQSEIDTMEYRKSDGQLYDFGTGPL